MSAVLTSVSREKGRGKTVSYIKYPSAWAPVISVEVQRQSPDPAQRPRSASGSPEKPTVRVQGGGLPDGNEARPSASFQPRARPTSALPGGRKLVVDIPSPERHSFQVMSTSHRPGGNPGGKSEVNLPQMPPDSGGICMGVD